MVCKKYSRYTFFETFSFKPYKKKAFFKEWHVPLVLYLSICHAAYYLSILQSFDMGFCQM